MRLHWVRVGPKSNNLVSLEEGHGESQTQELIHQSPSQPFCMPDSGFTLYRKQAPLEQFSGPLTHHDPTPGAAPTHSFVREALSRPLLRNHSSIKKTFQGFSEDIPTKGQHPGSSHFAQGLIILVASPWHTGTMPKLSEIDSADWVE